MMLTHDFPDSYRPLAQRLGLSHGLPFTAQWSAAADFLQLALGRCEVRRPRLIVECSSGLSTLVLARACALAGEGRVVSLENGAEFAAATRAALQAYGLEAWAKVVHAPLRDTSVGGESFQWYDLSGLSAVDAIDMLVIDGPPGFLQPRSRYPALPMLMERLTPGCPVLLDDAARDDERLLVDQWRKRYPLLDYRYHRTERGCAELTLPL
jgi:predicted O-methyltransferase YrrM